MRDCLYDLFVRLSSYSDCLSHKLKQPVFYLFDVEENFPQASIIISDDDFFYFTYKLYSLYLDKCLCLAFAKQFAQLAVFYNYLLRLLGFLDFFFSECQNSAFFL